MLKGLENRQMESGEQKSMRKQEKYFKIYEQIYETPDISFSRIAGNTGMARNTVVKLMEDIIYRDWLLLTKAHCMPSVTNKVELLNSVDN